MSKDFEPLRCANSACKMQLFNLKSVDMLRTPPRIGDLAICGSCGNVSKVTLTGTELITKEEFNKLTEDEKKDLTFAARAITRKLRSN